MPPPLIFLTRLTTPFSFGFTVSRLHKEAREQRHSKPFSASRNALVVVDVELRVRVRRPCRLEGDRDEVLAEDVREHRRAERAVLVEDLVHDIPGVHLALVPARDVRDVVLDDGGERRAVVDRGDPGWQLRVPDCGRGAISQCSGGWTTRTCLPRVWARTRRPFVVAKLTSASEPLNENWLREAVAYRQFPRTPVRRLVKYARSVCQDI